MVYVVDFNMQFLTLSEHIWHVLLCGVQCCALWCYREQQRQWRQEDIEQRHLDNARVLWARVVEKNRCKARLLRLQ